MLCAHPNDTYAVGSLESIGFGNVLAVKGRNVYAGLLNLLKFNLLDNFKIGIPLASIYLISFAGILTIFVVIREVAKQIHNEETVVREASRRAPKLSQRIASAVSNFNVTRLSAISVFALFVQLFIWFSELFLTNNIKTNKVVVDTSALIKDREDLLKTPLVACVAANEQMANMVTSAPTNDSILSKIYYEKTRLRPEMVIERKILKNDRCLLRLRAMDPGMVPLMQSELYIVGATRASDLLLGIPFLVSAMPKKIWFTRRNIYSYNLVVYHRRAKMRISQEILRNVENGLISRAHTCARNLGRANCRASKVDLFESLEEYTDAYSGFDDLDLANFRYVFIWYGLICSLVFVAFCVHHLANLIRKRVALIRSLLRLCKSRLRQIRFWLVNQFL